MTQIEMDFAAPLFEPEAPEVEPFEALGDATYTPDDNKLRLYPQHRLDEETYQRVRSAGFRWAPKQELFVAPAWTPEREDLLLELCGDIGDEDTTLVERASDRADRFEGYSGKRAAEGAAARRAVDELANGIPLGQPILVGHHSEKRARKDAERIENGMRRALRLFETSEYWTRRAAGAIRSAKYKQLPQVRARRIKKLEAERRRLVAQYTPAEPRMEITQRPIGGGDPEPHVWCGRNGPGGHWVKVSALQGIEAACARWISHLDRRLSYERALLESEGKTALLDKPKRPKAPPLLNYRAEQLEARDRWNRGAAVTYPQVEVTKAQYASVDRDYKATQLSPDGSHRFRTAIATALRVPGAKLGSGLVAVFLTDSKEHAPPAAASPAPPPPPPAPSPRRVARPRPEPTQAQRAAGELRCALKAGVRAVASPTLFETPPDVEERMLAEVVIVPGHRLLEPSAGTGRLARAARAARAEVTCVELSADLVAELRRQGFDVHTGDFLDWTAKEGFDVVLMNPPFNDGQDRAHVRHAFELLAPGGRLVAIMSEGPFFRQHRGDIAFRAWLEEVGGRSEKLPEGSFRCSGTGVNTRLVVIDR